MLQKEDSQEIGMFLPQVLIMYLLVLSGAFFYVGRAPERCCPGARLEWL
jgi:hypothetical protein